MESKEERIRKAQEEYEKAVDIYEKASDKEFDKYQKKLKEIEESDENGK